MRSQAYTIELGADADNIRFADYEKQIAKYTKARAITAKQLIDLDAEVNGGALVQVATLLGKPIYTRVNHHDPEVAKAEIASVQALIKDVVLGEL